MRHITIASPGNDSKLRMAESADLHAGPGQLRLAVQAIGVNFADCMVRQGLYASAKVYVGWPITPGFEVAGVVDEVGAGVAGWRIGDSALGLVRFGGYASQAVCAQSHVMRYPAAWAPEQAAGFPAVFLTAWYALHRLAQAQPGEAVLVHSAAGGVGQALVQLARIRGCRVLAVVGGAHKVAAVRALGCAQVVDKFSADWLAAARTFAPDGFAVALDANGVETLADSYRLLGPGGRLVVYGFHTMFARGGSGRRNWLRLGWNWLRTPRFNPLDLTTENKSVLAFNLSFLFERADVLAQALGYLLPLCEASELQPLPTQTFALADAGDAHRALESGKTVGKLVLLVTLLAALALGGCRGPQADKAHDYASARAAAAVVLATHCGSCHEESLPTAQPGALRVFNLENPEWPERLTLQRVQSMAARLRSPLGEEGKPRRVSAQELAVFDRFVAAWVGRRAKQ